MTKERPFLPDQRKRGGDFMRAGVARFLADGIAAQTKAIAESGQNAIDDMDAEFLTGALVFLELVRADLIAAGHMTEEDFTDE